MRNRHVWRIAALVLGILACLGFALGACMAKRSRVASPQPGSGTTTGHTAPASIRADEKSGRVDGGADSVQRKPRPKPKRAAPKSNKGMLRQMHLEGGE